MLRRLLLFMLLIVAHRGLAQHSPLDGRWPSHTSTTPSPYTSAPTHWRRHEGGHKSAEHFRKRPHTTPIFNIFLQKGTSPQLASTPPRSIHNRSVLPGGSAEDAKTTQSLKTSQSRTKLLNVSYILNDKDNIKGKALDGGGGGHYIEGGSDGDGGGRYAEGGGSNGGETWLKKVGLCHPRRPGEGDGLCRVGGRCLPSAVFALEACALCYTYIPNIKFHQKLAAQQQLYVSSDGTFNITHLSNGSNSVVAAVEAPDAAILSSFKSGESSWKDCCEAAKACCVTMTTLPTDNTPADSCPKTWDGWQCWPDTSANTTAEAPCPPYIYYFTQPPSCQRSAHKVCGEDGIWFKRGGVEWSNYSTCSVVGVLQHRVKVHLVAHSLSVVSLIPALFLFFSYKQLRVPRVVMHKNLFTSLLLNSVVTIIFLTSVMLRQDRNHYIQENTAGCVVLLLLTKFCRLTSYMWMFCEAAFLHHLVTAAFNQRRSFAIYYVIGWGFPVQPVVVYAWLRARHGNTQCWVVPHHSYEWILNVPCLLALLLNIVFMINILRVLVTKLRAANTHEPSQYRKTVRATLVLIPLFGLHFLLTLYRPASVACTATELYHYANSCIDGLQGFFVSLAFCYCNGEVQYLVSRTYRRWCERRETGKSHRPSQSLTLGRSSVALLNTNTSTSVDCTRYTEEFGLSLESRGIIMKTLSIPEENLEDEEEEKDDEDEEEEEGEDKEVDKTEKIQLCNSTLLNLPSSSSPSSPRGGKAGMITTEL